jgi:hypothetical protein
MDNKWSKLNDPGDLIAVTLSKLIMLCKRLSTTAIFLILFCLLLKKISWELSMCYVSVHIVITGVLNSKDGSFNSISHLAGILKCPICLELLFAPVVLNCSHTFCQLCIGTWRKEKNTCPICRVLIKSGNRAIALDQIIYEVEREVNKRKFKNKREEQRRKYAQFMKNCPRQVGNAIPEQVVARDVIRREMTEFVMANGILSQVRIQFDHAPAVINREFTSL